MGDEGFRVRVMTWNIWWRFGPQWRERQPGIRETLSAVDADVVALQEVWGTAGTTQADELGEQLGRYAAFAEPSYPPAPEAPRDPDFDGVTVGVALLSRWPIIGVRTVGMPARHRPLDPVALVATVDHPVGALPVVVACLEYEPAYKDDRIAQARLLAELATDPALDGPVPVLVAGDLNAAADSPVLRPLHDVLTDAWAAGGGDPGAVTLSSTHPSAPLGALGADRPPDRPRLLPARGVQPAGGRRLGRTGRSTRRRRSPLRPPRRRLRPELDRGKLMSEVVGQSLVDAARAGPGGRTARNRATVLDPGHPDRSGQRRPGPRRVRQCRQQPAGPGPAAPVLADPFGPW